MTVNKPNRFFKQSCLFIIFIAATIHLVFVVFAQNQNQNNPEPAVRNVHYGEHANQVFDLWLAKSSSSTPLVLYIHGGGFSGGSKNSINTESINTFLNAGISVAAVEYRFVPEFSLPTAHNDCKQAIQFLRANADKWNFNKNRFGAFGGSAGAQLCMWLAFHDDMTDAESTDKLEKESTRLTCVATNGGQTTMDFDWWMKWIPEYDKPHRSREEYFGEKEGEILNKIIRDISALDQISKDDPPIYMSYSMKPGDPVPRVSGEARGWKVHHVMFGVKLKQVMDDLGIEAVLTYPGSKSKYSSREDFLIKKLKN